MAYRPEIEALMLLGIAELQTIQRDLAREVAIGKSANQVTSSDFTTQVRQNKTPQAALHDIALALYYLDPVNFEKPTVRGRTRVQFAPQYSTTVTST